MMVAVLRMSHRIMCDEQRRWKILMTQTTREVKMFGYLKGIVKPFTFQKYVLSFEKK